MPPLLEMTSQPCDGENQIRNLLQCILYFKNGNPSDARLRLAEFIMEGRIKEYDPGTAYTLLCLWSNYDGIRDYRLGECVLRGIGTDRDPIVALKLLEEALDRLDSTLYFLDRDDEFTIKEVEESFHDRKDYEKACEKTKEYIEEAKGEICKMSEYDIMHCHSGL